MKQRGAHIIWSCLIEQGVDTVFGYPGGAILPAYDALLDHPIRHVLVRHEQGATHMADGYARASGKVGIAIATGLAIAAADAGERLAILRLRLAADGEGDAGLRHQVAFEARVDEYPASEYAA